MKVDSLYFLFVFNGRTELYLLLGVREDAYMGNEEIRVRELLYGIRSWHETRENRISSTRRYNSFGREISLLFS